MTLKSFQTTIICVLLFAAELHTFAAHKKNVVQNSNTKNVRNATKNNKKIHKQKQINNKLVSKSKKQKLFTNPIPSRKKNRAFRIPKSAVVMLRDTLAQGVFYEKISLKSKIVHRISCENTELFMPRVLLSDSGLGFKRKLSSLISEESKNDILGAVNASFWSGGTNFPINPTIVDGEIQTMKQHKQWSSAFISSSGKVFIDRFTLQGKIWNKQQPQGSQQSDEVQINDVNSLDYKQLDTLHSSVVMFTRRWGTSFPKDRKSKNIVKNHLPNILEADVRTVDSLRMTVTNDESDSLALALAGDETDEAISLQVKNNSISDKYQWRIVCEYLTAPIINRPIRIRVRSIIKNLPADIPENCFLLVSTNQLPWNENDELQLQFSTNVASKTPFIEAIGGTPRLIRNGNISIETNIEGSKAKRFIRKRLPRTAIGIDHSGQKVILATIDGGGQNNGANLSEWASILKSLGCHDALNLDGGGSSTMAVRSPKNYVAEDSTFAEELPQSIAQQLVQEPTPNTNDSTQIQQNSNENTSPEITLAQSANQFTHNIINDEKPSVKVVSRRGKVISERKISVGIGFGSKITR